MSVEDYRPAKLFTIEQANAMLPLVRAITADAVRLSREIVDRRRRLDHLTSGRQMESGDPYDDELSEMEEELENDSRQLQAYIDELRQLGVEPKSFPEGLVDFPSIMDDRIVYLCWKYGEPEVQHWHELESGFAGRRPLEPAVAGQDVGGDGIES